MGLIEALVVIPFCLCISASLLLLGVNMAKVEGATFGKALKSTLVGSVGVLIAEFVLGLIPVIGGVLGLAVGFLFSVVVTASVFATTLGKAIVAEVIHAGAFLVGIFVLLFLMTGGSAVSPFMYTLF